ncbi:MAG: hypothetical protein QXD13_02030 [Candidatus Pacearchaeota archaeon]
MFFGKKKTIKCEICRAKINEKYSFCPYCGSSLIDEAEEAEDFGLLGKNDFLTKTAREPSFFSGFGISDKMISSLMKNLMKSFSTELKSMQGDNFENAEIHQLPNGISIKVSSKIPQKSQNPKKTQLKKHKLTEEQINKISKLPRVSAKTNVRRFSDKVVYELAAPGIKTIDDIFVSKLENGYEIKALSDKKVYVNTLPINLPLKKYTIKDNKIFFEFKTQ